MLGALLRYAYGLGARSRRRIQRLCRRDVAFRVITANQGPDHTTIARFRRTHKQAVASLFTDVLRLCAEAGLVPGGVGALDGTKIKAVAALAANRTAATIEKAVATMLAEARRVDEAEARVDETNREALPEVVRDRTSRPARRCEC